MALNNWYQTYYDVLQTSIPTGSGSGPNADRSELRDAVYAELVRFVYVVAPAVVVHPVAGWLRNGAPCGILAKPKDVGAFAPVLSEEPSDPHEIDFTAHAQRPEHQDAALKELGQFVEKGYV